MEGNFELNVPGWYTVKNAVPNDFLNKKSSDEDKAKYGLTYSVSFQGDAETFLWTTKTPPEDGKKYYGHLQPTSGRSLRFKTDKLPENEANAAAPVPGTPPSGGQNLYLKDVSDMPFRIWKDLVNLIGVPKTEADLVKFEPILIMHTELVLRLVDGVRNMKKEESKSDTGWVDTAASAANNSSGPELVRSQNPGLFNRDTVAEYDPSQDPTAAMPDNFLQDEGRGGTGY